MFLTKLKIWFYLQSAEIKLPSVTCLNNIETLFRNMYYFVSIIVKHLVYIMHIIKLADLCRG